MPSVEERFHPPLASLASAAAPIRSVADKPATAAGGGAVLCVIAG
jgi:hypothetical protein